MPEITLLIFFMAGVTFLPRVLPILILSRRSLPKPIERWLTYVPVSVLAALLAPALFAPAGALNFAVTENPALWVSFPVFIVAFLTRNLIITVLSGMILIALFRFFI